MFRAVLNLFGHWDLTDEEAATLLDMPVRTFRRWKAGDVGESTATARRGSPISWASTRRCASSSANRSEAMPGSRRPMRPSPAQRARRHARRRADRPDARAPLSRRRARRLVIDRATFRLARRVARRVRIIRSRFPPIDLFEDIADPADWPLLISAEQKTNPRLMETIGNLDLVPPARRVGGAGASYLMAPFTHVSTDRPSRFSRRQLRRPLCRRWIRNGAVRDDPPSCPLHGRGPREPPGWTSQFREIVLDVDGRLA